MSERVREREIRKTLRRMARQRVALILQPGNVWVVEKAPKWTEDTAAILRTCHLRGWVEPVENAVPTGSLTPDGRIPPDVFTRLEPIYRLTEGGWNAINRTHTWVIVTCFVATASFVVGVLSAVIGLL